MHALSWGGATPVFCDVDPDTHLLDPEEVEALITPRTTGILGVHLWGLPCDGDRLSAIARRHGVPLLFDGAHAFGAARGAGYVPEGAATVFSFHATKIVNACEGGAVLTDDDVLAERLRAGRSFGFTGVDCVSALGINAKMSEAAAAMGLTSLESFETFAAANRRNYAAYVDGLRDLPGVSVRAPERMADTTHHYVVVEIDAASARFTRDQAVRVTGRRGRSGAALLPPGLPSNGAVSVAAVAEAAAEDRVAVHEGAATADRHRGRARRRRRHLRRPAARVASRGGDRRSARARRLRRRPEGMTPDISVIVVTYNHARFIGEALAGVFGQQLHSHVEVIVSDDASTDGTLDLVARIAAANGPPVRIIRSAHNLNSNIVTVRAIAAARGRYVAIMDGDDFWTAPDKLARQQRFLERHPDCAVCFHDQIDTDENGRPLAVAVAHRDVSEWTASTTSWSATTCPGRRRCSAAPRCRRCRRGSRAPLRRLGAAHRRCAARAHRPNPGGARRLPSP